MYEACVEAIADFAIALGINVPTVRIPFHGKTTVIKIAEV